MRPYLEEKKSQKRAGGVVQGIGPEIEPQNCKKKKKRVKQAQHLLKKRAKLPCGRDLGKN
jgi:glutamine amidotransferase-like uncharacterized protein